MKRLALLLCLIPSMAPAAVLYVKAAGGNSNAAATWSNVSSLGIDSSGPPTINDDCIADLNSGALTINAALSCGTFSATDGVGPYVSSITHSAATTWTVASTFTFVSGMTYLMGNSATSAISFLGNNSTGTITTSGKVMGTASFGGAGAVFSLADAWISTNTSQTMTVTSGTFHIDGAADNLGLSPTVGLFNSSNANARFLYLGVSSITCTVGGTNAWNTSTATNMTFRAGGSTITISGANSTFSGGGALTYWAVYLKGSNANINLSGASIFNQVSYSGGGTMTFGSALTIATFSIVGINARTDNMVLSAVPTVTNYFNILGNSSLNRLLLAGSPVGTSITATVAGATITATNADFRDIALSQSWNFSAISGLSGDCGGNSGMVLTTAAPQTRGGTVTFDWSTAGWTSRVPLCQDDVTLTHNFGSGQTITASMPRLGRSVDMSAVTWTGTAPTFSNSTPNSVYGNLTFSTNGGTGTMLWTGNNGFTFLGRSGSFTLQSGGLNFGTGISFNAPGATYALQDAYSASGFTTTLSTGTLDANNFNVTSNIYVFTAGAVRMGSGTWAGGGTGTVWSMPAGVAVSSATSVIFVSNTTSSAKTFAGGNKEYYDLRISSGPSAGTLTFTGNNTFHDMIARAPKFLRFTNASTTTISGNIYTDSVAGSSVCFFSTTGGARFFFDAATPNARRQCLDWISMKDGQVRPSVGIWYGGDNGTDTSNNANWRFESCYKQSNFFMMM